MEKETKKTPGFGQLKDALSQAVEKERENAGRMDFELNLSDYEIVVRDVLGPLEIGDFQTAADNAFDCANTGIVDGLSAEDRNRVLERIDAHTSKAQVVEDRDALKRARKYFVPRS